MQNSRIKKLLHPIKGLKSLWVRKSSAETSELREATEVKNEERIMQDEPLTAEEVAQDTSAEPIYSEGDELTEGESGEKTTPPTTNTKAHLSSSVPRAASLPRGVLTKGEMAEIRSIFGDMDDAEIQRLYKRVTK